MIPTTSPGPASPPIADDPNALAKGMRLVAALKRSQKAEAKKSAYQRAYWQEYKDRVKRIHGTLKPDVHAALAAE